MTSSGGLRHATINALRKLLRQGGSRIFSYKAGTPSLPLAASGAAPRHRHFKLQIGGGSTTNVAAEIVFKSIKASAYFWCRAARDGLQNSGEALK